ncbi:MAG: hypothetical protein ICV76_01685, partial [Nitrospiraceae bacterium]|nr:hypothetical protein [Nitrospiraceae bacterium]
MDHSLIVPLKACTEPWLVGGKAAGLGKLIRHGFPVPPGLCVTTAVYDDTLRAGGMDYAHQWVRAVEASDAERERILSECRRSIEALTLSETVLQELESELDKLVCSSPAGQDTLWAVRSSATDEDAATASFAGVYRTRLGVPRRFIASAVMECWSLLWTPAALVYRRRAASRSDAFAQARQDAPFPGMAVVVQPIISPSAAGVAYSCHPVTGRSDVVVVNSIYGLAEPLVDGRSAPDHFVVQMAKGSKPVRILERRIAEKASRSVVTPTGPQDQPVHAVDRLRPSLDDRRLHDLAALAKKVEQAFGVVVDVEWALDHDDIWLLQARPISTVAPSHGPSYTWSRANFKETWPEVPSPLGLSYVERFMEMNMIRHYRESGCVIPPNVSSVRILYGRPYINVTLFQSLSAQLGGNPELVTEQMGGEPAAIPSDAGRLPWWRLVRAGFKLGLKIFRAPGRAPAWFEELKRMAAAQHEPLLHSLTETALLERLDALGTRLEEGELTFAAVGGVAQALDVLRTTLARRTSEWRPLLNAATQGFGQIISADQIVKLISLAETAQHEPLVRGFFLHAPPSFDGFRCTLNGTRFLEEFDCYLAEYGPRAIGESDIMTPRFAETPEYVLSVIKNRLLSEKDQSIEKLHRDQGVARQAALDTIRELLAWRVHEWIWFRWWHRSLGKYLALRESNRHYLMHYMAGVRRILLVLGDKLRSRGVVESREDVFFFTEAELRSAVRDPKPEWKHVMGMRRVERETKAAQPVPDT